MQFLRLKLHVDPDPEITCVDPDQLFSSEAQGVIHFLYVCRDVLIFTKNLEIQTC